MISKKPRILLVEDDGGLRTQLSWALEAFDVATAEDRPRALRVVQEEHPAVVILDLGLPPDPDGASEGLQAIRDILALAPETKIIVSTGNEDKANAVAAIGAGAYDLYSKPVDVDMLSLTINRALHVHALEVESRNRPEGKTEALAGLITGDPGMLRICRSIERVASADVSVLLLGESGTGKDVIARAIHGLSSRANRPFVAINCAAIPETLLESELFGHERGAFTGAIKQTLGKIEVANRGTLFLDEIGDFPLLLQAKLLRFLQERVIERLGGRQQISVDVRVISATNKDLPALVRANQFREDLFYRLNEVRLDIPPLRDRPGDALLLVQHFLREFARTYKRNVKGLATDAIEAVSTYDWPGNVREIENRVKRAVIMADGKLLSAADLDLAAPVAADQEEFGLRNAREQAERTAIQKALARENGNVSRAAKALGVSRPTLYGLIRQHNIRI
ncbi:MAG: PEP-CTERM-box response regulator transcription factor [Alphaproteobacteria bacterium]|nr:PEP-CTERM-box response regulator transcription factor [Alphaproteobacteria bacterium]